MPNYEKPYSRSEFEELEDKIKALRKSEDVFLSLPRNERKMVDFEKIQSDIADSKTRLQELLAKAQADAIDEDIARNEIKQYQHFQKELESILRDISEAELAEI